jgi:hypothetical protein
MTPSNLFYDGFARRVREAERAGCHKASVVIAVSQFLELRPFYQVPNEKNSRRAQLG